MKNKDQTADGGNIRTMGMLTDVGQVREIDEDSIMAADLSFGTNGGRSKFKLLIVADGMGGHAKGEVASKIALNCISNAVIPHLLDDIPFIDLLKGGIENANRMILEYTKKHPDATGMGTTAVCALVKDNEVYVGNIGDSRAYVVSDDQIRRVTRDHSHVQELVDEGSITYEESRTHPKKNVITKAIGATELAEPDMMSFVLDDDESLLLCCDGVMAHLTDSDIHKTLLNTDPQDACKRIVDMANKRGGTDNISLIVLSPVSAHA